jgi:predicted AAA+ superfamily ATPase
LGEDPSTIRTYLEILEDTLLGFHIEAHHRSVRKRQRKGPKFYLFDPGLKKALQGTLTQALLPGTSGYARAFEHWVVLEFWRRNDYHRGDFRFSYLRTKDGAEIDLIVTRPARATVLVEIKSPDRVDQRATRTLEAMLPAFPNAQAYCLSTDPSPKQIGNVRCVPWDMGIREIMG